ncbi:MAG: glycosyltransferase family 2 protein [Candidatus Aenigmatarchaeota archaeon]
MATEVAVIIPAFNEEKNISRVIKRIKKSINAEIIVVDDSSKDRTREVALKSGVKVISHKINKGKGGALKTGFEEVLTKYPEIKYIILIDADSQYDPEDMPKLLEALKRGYDYVTGFRNWKRDVPFRHRFANFLWRNAFNLLFGVRLFDSNCGFIGMNRRALKIISKDSYGGYIIDNMMMANAIKSGLKIKQVPVKVYYKERRDIITGIRFFLGCLVFIVEEGIRFRFGWNFRVYVHLARTKLIFSKGG